MTFDLLAKGDGMYSVEALASASQADGTIVHGTGQASVKVVSPLLSFGTTLDPAVHPGFLWGAGVPYTVNLTVRDLSYRKSVVLVPRLRFQGNAQGGQLIASDAEIPPGSGEGGCSPSEVIQLAPREKKKFKVGSCTPRTSAPPRSVRQAAGRGRWWWSASRSRGS